MKPIRTWIVVADGARARFYCNDGPGRGIQELPEYARENDLRPSREIDADRPGRTFDSRGEGRHAKERPTDPHRHAKRVFARQITADIEAACHANAFDRLVVVAPPAALGDIRQELPKAVAARLHGEIAKDLTHLGPAELADQLGSVLAV